ncbi:MAG: hypothetical protein ACRDSF_09005 [Pseudonocardiaceae bacterium]
MVSHLAGWGAVVEVVEPESVEHTRGMPHDALDCGCNLTPAPWATHQRSDHDSSGKRRDVVQGPVATGITSPVSSIRRSHLAVQHAAQAPGAHKRFPLRDHPRLRLLGMIVERDHLSGEIIGMDGARARHPLAAAWILRRT